jgi:hypothetical protein
MIDGPTKRLPRHMRTPARFLAALLLGLLAAPAFADSYGEIIANIDDQPPGDSSHGYLEYWVRIENRSTSANHEVKLTMPKSEEFHTGDFIRSVTRTVTIEPGKTVRVALAYPERHMLSGSSVGVTVDGRDYEAPLRLSRSAMSGFSRGMSYVYGGSRTSTPAQVLCSKSIDPRFSSRAQSRGGEIDLGVGMPTTKLSTFRLPAGPGSSAIEVTTGSMLAPINYPAAALPAPAWSPNWLGYSRYDGIVLTADDLRAMTAEARTAVEQFVECGGVLLIFGADPPLPGDWKLGPIAGLPLAACPAGFGYCFHCRENEPWSMDSRALDVVRGLVTQANTRLQQVHSPAEANRMFPVIENLGVPVRGLLLLMIAFTIGIGPVNLVVLTRMKRKLWLFWTIPAVSAVTCIAVLGSMVLAEGWDSKSRVESFTVLDENSRHAATLGWYAYYTPLLSGGGLHFSPRTEVTYQDENESARGYSYRRRTAGSALSIDWTRDQHLVSGWIAPRVPSHFELRKGDIRRERVVIAPGSDGKLEAVNGLGADISEFWYVNDAGAMFTAQSIPAGGRAALTPAAKPALNASMKSLRMIFAGSWHDASTIRANVPGLLSPRTYLAMLESAPFLDEVDPKGAMLRAKSAVFGIQKEGNDGG